MNEIHLIHIITEPTKFKILQLLLDHHYCVQALSKKLDISESAVSQQLNTLKKNQIVHGIKIGYQVHYQVDKQLLEDSLSTFLSALKKKMMTGDVSSDCTCEFASECVKYNANRRTN